VLIADRSIEQILSPLIIRTPHQSHNVTAGVQIESMRLAHKLHAGLGWQLVPLAPIAGMTAGHKVLPTGRTTA
jgi:hypothetical protein